MAHVFLDANCLIDLFVRGDTSLAATLDPHQLSTSVLSLHILAYVGKERIPSELLSQIGSMVNLVGVTGSITKRSLQGPTVDLEDNIQLHSAVAVGCDFFLSRDANLLKLAWSDCAIISPQKLKRVLASSPTV